ncbi:MULTISPECIES: BadF/BadG/BcrA/BcrD ATPase family protein [unclassified Agromyces]|uniref:BadF/BadG/BcrA/BcrD ATPase family protein n=1 Tax=unclassified Agromyces TaxID=2639701 RepID=UPI0030157249
MTGGVRFTLDAGQSSIRLRVSVAGAEARELVLPGVRTDRSPIEQVAAVVEGNRALAPESVAVGLSGFDAAPDAAGHLLAAAPSVRRAAVAHDSVTGYLGANGESEGVVAAVGTGVVVLGVGPTAIARVDGWGALLGDAGSAYWIGRAGLDAALRSADGRGPARSLLAAAVERFGRMERIYLELQADPDRVARIAAFAPAVTSAAEAGDDPALRIVGFAAQELADSIRAALERSGADPATARVSAVGRVVTSAVLRDALQRALHHSGSAGAGPGPLQLAEPLGEPVDGVERLHDLGADHPLAAAVVTATR